MCGIAGIVSLNNKPIANASERIRCMTRMLDHRGPDQWGAMVTSDRLLALGNTRLSIVDPEAQLKLPVQFSPDAVLSFNGEIYDYLDIRRNLSLKGVSFCTQTDTEVLYQALRTEGETALESLDGMWAIAYYDFETKRLLLSRDLMGERHLFYHVNGNEMIFASEMEPLLTDKGGCAEIDFEAFICSLRFSTAPPGRTLIKGYKRLKPGHNLSIDVQKGTIKEYRYRKLHPERWFDYFRKNPSTEDVVDTFRNVFDKVVTRRLPKDVPFMSTLSGGIDSTIISIAASEYGKRKIKTLYGLSYEKPPKRYPDTLDEYEASKLTSAKYGMEHHFITMYKDDCIPVLRYAAANGFDGCLDSAVSSFEMLARKVRQEGAKVMLISDGPDELAGGYPIDQAAYAIDRLRENKRLHYEALKRLSQNRLTRHLMSRLGQSSKMISSHISYDPFSFIPVHSSISPEVIAQLVPRQRAEEVINSYGTLDEEYAHLIPELDFTQIRALTYAAKSLPDLFNLRTDKAFLHASVECRVPFQAPDIVDFLIALPAKFRFGNGTSTKFLLRKVVEDLVGPEVACRGKYGFSRPQWRDKDVYRALKIDKVIQETEVFDLLPFQPYARALSLKPEYGKIRWKMYVLAKTFDRLSQGIKAAAHAREQTTGVVEKV